MSADRDWLSEALALIEGTLRPGPRLRRISSDLAPGGLARPADLRLEWRDGGGVAYDFHLNDVAVHSDPGAGPATWIIGREMFERVEFELFGPDRRIHATLAPDVHNPWRADVRLEWGRRVTMRGGKKWRIGTRGSGTS